MEMSLPVYTLKELPVDSVTFAAELPLSGPLPGLSPPAEGPLPPPPASAAQVVTSHAVCALADVAPPAAAFPEPAAHQGPPETAQQRQQHQIMLEEQPQQLQQPELEDPERREVSAEPAEASEVRSRGRREEVGSQPADGVDADDPEEGAEWERPRKRPRIDITVEQKRQICLYHNEHSKATARQMVEYFYKEWGVTVGRSTIAAVIGNKKKWLSMSEDKGKSKRARTGKHEMMEQRLYSWYMEQRAAGAYIPREQLFNKAREIGSIVGIPESFAYSKGWLQKFQSRYNFRVTSEKSKTDAASKRFMLFRRKQLEHDLELAPPADVFCFAEFPLLYQLVPRVSVVRSPATMREHNRSVSVCLCPNMTGSTRLPPLVLGRTVTCGFSSKFSQDKLLQYRYSARGQLTENLFSEWLYRVDEQMRKERRVALILVGATSCSVERSYKLTNVKLRFLSTIGARSPLELGIKLAFKIGYRRLQCQYLLDEADEEALSGPELRSAIYLIRESWRQLPDNVIVGAWAAAGVVPESRLNEALAGVGEVKTDVTDPAETVAAEAEPAAPAPQPEPTPLPVVSEVVSYYCQHQPQQQGHPQHEHNPHATLQQPQPDQQQQHHQEHHPHLHQHQQEQHHCHQHQQQEPHHQQEQQHHHQQEQNHHHQQEQHHHQHQQQPEHHHHQHQQQQGQHNHHPPHSHAQHYQPAAVPQQQQQFFHALPADQGASLQPLTVVSSYDASLGQHFLAPFGVSAHSGGGGAFLLPDQTAEQLRITSPPKPPPPPPPPPLPDAGQLNQAAMQRLQTEMTRLPVPASDLLTVEWLLGADDLPEPKSEPEPAEPAQGALVSAPEPVTQSVALWAADTLLVYLEQRDADTAAIDSLLLLRRRWLTRLSASDKREHPPT